MLRRPKAVSDYLGVSPATLRRWSESFAVFLSESASKSASGGNGSSQRRYSDLDIAVLARVKSLLATGYSIAEAVVQLSETPTDLPEEGISSFDPRGADLSSQVRDDALIAVEAFRAALASKDKTIAVLEATVENQQRAINRQEQHTSEVIRLLAALEDSLTAEQKSTA